MKRSLNLKNFPSELKELISKGKVFTVRILSGKSVQELICKVADKAIDWNDNTKLGVIVTSDGNKNKDVNLEKVTLITVGERAFDFVVHNFLDNKGNLELGITPLLSKEQREAYGKLPSKARKSQYLTALGYTKDTVSRLVDMHITNVCRVLREQYNPGCPNANYAAKVEKGENPNPTPAPRTPKKAAAKKPETKVDLKKKKPDAKKAAAKPNLKKEPKAKAVAPAAPAPKTAAEETKKATAGTANAKVTSKKPAAKKKATTKKSAAAKK